jgi:predicted secreted protein
MKFSDFTDNRDRRMIFLNNCLMNQTSRAPGVAYREGASTELIQLILDNGLSIEQLPCLECIGIGGVSRKSFDRYLPLLSNSIKNGWFSILKLILKVWLINFERLCKKEARKVVDRIEDYVTEGYTILGVVGMNDSPTCGVTKTLDFIEYTRRLVLSKDTGSTPKQIIQETLVDGTSFFIGNIMKELEKRGLDVKVIGFEPWTESHKEEAERIASLLNLEF